MVGCGFIVPILFMCLLGLITAESLEGRMQALEMTVLKQGTTMQYLEKQVSDLTTILEHQRETKNDLQHDVQTMKHLLEERDQEIVILNDRIEDLETVVMDQQDELKTLQQTIRLKMRHLKNSETFICGASPEGQRGETKAAKAQDKAVESILKNITKSETYITAMHSIDKSQRQKPMISETMPERGPRSLGVQSLQNVEHTERQERMTEGSVAFHAVLSPGSKDHMGTSETIPFDFVHLNIGNGYHNLLGVFIAPKAGIYLFSTSITAGGTTTYKAYLLKNGSKLVSISAVSTGWSGINQGSVTIVTELKVGDEVWVVHAEPADGSIWGNYYTSFAGVLIVSM